LVAMELIQNKIFETFQVYWNTKFVIFAHQYFKSCTAKYKCMPT